MKGRDGHEKVTRIEDVGVIRRGDVVRLGNGDVVRALGPDGRWRWGAEQRTEKREQRTDPEVMSGAAPKKDAALWEAVVGAGVGVPAPRALRSIVIGGETYLVDRGYLVGKEQRTEHRRDACATRTRERRTEGALSSLARVNWGWVLLAAALLAAAVLSGGCAARVGTAFSQDQAGRSAVNGGPNTVAVNIPDGETTTAAGVGTSSYSVTADGSGGELRTLTQGTPVRQVTFSRKPDGTVAVNVTSGSDVSAEGLTYDGDSLTVKKFSTLTSAPTRALNEGYAALEATWISRDQASRDAIVAQVRAAENIAADVRQALVGALLGIPVP